MPRPLAILGAGNLATALALHMAPRMPVRLFCIEPDVVRAINIRRNNPRYLQGCRIPKNVIASSSIADTVRDAQAVFVAVPSHAACDVIRQSLPALPTDATVVLFTKGMCPDTQEPIGSAVARLLPARHARHFAVIGGPAIATEFARGSPTALIIASKHPRTRALLRRLLEHGTVKTATTDDVRGVGLASELKNAYAIGLGLCDGLGYATNAKALVLTLAMAELERLFAAAGAKKETARGLAGLGDLLVTGLSAHGRNRTYGERLATAKTRDPIALGLTTVEGIAATTAGLKLARQHRVNVPLLQAIERCVNARRSFATPFVTYLRRVRLP